MKALDAWLIRHVWQPLVDLLGVPVERLCRTLMLLGYISFFAWAIVNTRWLNFVLGLLGVVTWCVGLRLTRSLSRLVSAIPSLWRISFLIVVALGFEWPRVIADVLVIAAVYVGVCKDPPPPRPRVKLAGSLT